MSKVQYAAVLKPATVVQDSFRATVRRGSEGLRKYMALMYALLGLLIFAARGEARHCEYGSLPGHIVVSATNVFPMQWEQLDSKCQMTQELNKYLGLDPTGQDAVRDRNISFLLYGDASDGFMAKDICDLSAQTGVKFDSGTNGLSPYCLLQGLQLVSQIIPGVAPQGPYAQGFSEEDAPSKSIPKGLENFKRLTGKQTPDVVVFSGLLQDVRRMLEHNKQEMTQEFLSKEHVQTWIDQTKAQLKSIESQHDNSTLLIFHGAVYPMLVDCKFGGDHANAMGKRTHIIQLNKAALHIMQEHPRWHLVDYDQMSMPFSLTGVHLRDGIHAGPPFLAQVLNIYLNLCRQHLLETGQKPLPPPSGGQTVAQDQQAVPLVQGNAAMNPLQGVLPNAGVQPRQHLHGAQQANLPGSTAFGRRL